MYNGNGSMHLFVKTENSLLFRRIELIKSEIKCSLCHNFALGYPTFSLARPTNYCYCWAILFDNERIKSSLRSLVTTERLSGLPMTPEHLLVDRNWYSLCWSMHSLVTKTKIIFFFFQKKTLIHNKLNKMLHIALFCISNEKWMGKPPPVTLSQVCILF